MKQYLNSILTTLSYMIRHLDHHYLFKMTQLVIKNCDWKLIFLQNLFFTISDCWLEKNVGEWDILTGITWEMFVKWVNISGGIVRALTSHFTITYQGQPANKSLIFFSDYNISVEIYQSRRPLWFCEMYKHVRSDSEGYDVTFHNILSREICQ